MQEQGWDDRIAFPESNEATGWSYDVSFSIWWLVGGVCIWYAPQVLANWLDVSSL